MDKGSNIALLREQLGLTQAEFARDLGVAKETVCRWEKNRTAIRPRHIQKMVKLYGVTEDDILSDSIGLAAREALRSAKGEGLNPQTRDAFPILRIKRSGNGTSLQSVGATLTPSDIAERHLHAAYVQMNNKDMTLLYPPRHAAAGRPRREAIQRLYGGGGHRRRPRADSQVQHGKQHDRAFDAQL